ncbi:hypothetical protein ACA758_00660 [Mycoplasmopsis agassizii]|uniref:Uncharacterized protein n=1 Tax=Mycoplasmopsis agassizii TaxID=33922 RepID=A0ABX4H4D2_9BACT|nr:hypothetical protein [Mycoplasmopsis agassizii]PAF54740.1 hypothetical protein CJF60_03305 [Mycoplasmopsis agassizii]SMC15891.1 hypothetical protein SAMN02745179_00141 [Mycoplasmopsis agassizii]
MKKNKLSHEAEVKILALHASTYTMQRISLMEWATYTEDENFDMDELINFLCSSFLYHFYQYWNLAQVKENLQINDFINSMDTLKDILSPRKFIEFISQGADLKEFLLVLLVQRIDWIEDLERALDYYQIKWLAVQYANYLIKEQYNGGFIVGEKENSALSFVKDVFKKLSIPFESKSVKLRFSDKSKKTLISVSLEAEKLVPLDDYLVEEVLSMEDVQNFFKRKYEEFSPQK